MFSGSSAPSRYARRFMDSKLPSNSASNPAAGSTRGSLSLLVVAVFTPPTRPPRLQGLETDLLTNENDRSPVGDELASRSRSGDRGDMRRWQHPIVATWDEVEHPSGTDECRASCGRCARRRG